MIAATERADLRSYFVVSLWFGCNNDCTLCMLHGFREKLPPIGFDRFREAVVDIRDGGFYRNLIFSGAEVTTFTELERYAEFAASLGWFKKIQIQTNGRRLADIRYLRGLVDSGINEFFVSLHGTEAVHDGITRRPGSFRDTLTGLRNLAAFDVNVISNCVLTRENAHNMETLMALLSAEKISEFHMWNYFPMREDGRAGLVVDLDQVVALMPRLRKMLGPEQRPLVMKAFPHCLLSPPGVVFDSWFPVTLLPDVFWKEFGQSGFGCCPYRDGCADRSCWGLSETYRTAFGDARDRLRPIREAPAR
jgi:molybdenum cofactor biosynthesis enzyme MoaA